MPRCTTCGEFVTQNYVQVFALPGMTDVNVCPHCEGDVRDEVEGHEIPP